MIAQEIENHIQEIIDREAEIAKSNNRIKEICGILSKEMNIHPRTLSMSISLAKYEASEKGTEPNPGQVLEAVKKLKRVG